MRITQQLYRYYQNNSDHIQEVRTFYKAQRDKMINAAETHLTGLAEWDTPTAGLFLWIKLNGIHDTSTLIEEKAREANGILIIIRS